MVFLIPHLCVVGICARALWHPLSVLLSQSRTAAAGRIPGVVDFRMDSDNRKLNQWTWYLVGHLQVPDPQQNAFSTWRQVTGDPEIEDSNPTGHKSAHKVDRNW